MQKLKQTHRIECVPAALLYFLERFLFKDRIAKGSLLMFNFKLFPVSVRMGPNLCQVENVPENNAVKSLKLRTCIFRRQERSVTATGSRTQLLIIRNSSKKEIFAHQLYW